MLCFGFTCKQKGLIVELCEEIVEIYSTIKKVSFTINLILKSTNNNNKYLGVWHRGNVGCMDINNTEALLNRNSPATKLFCYLDKKRGILNKTKRTINFRLFEIDSDTCKTRLREQHTYDISVPSISKIKKTNPIEDGLKKKGLPVPPASKKPFSYASIGPFFGKDRYFAIRITACLKAESFERLVTEDLITKERLHRVYGIKEIIGSIRGIDLPNLRRANFTETKEQHSEIYNEYLNIFEEQLERNCIIPKFNSVVVLTKAKTTRTIINRTDFMELNIPNKSNLVAGKHVHWYVNKRHSQNYLFWIEIPMAEKPQKKRAEIIEGRYLSRFPLHQSSLHSPPS